MIIRKDWLDELGLKMPVTIDDWHGVLKEFKEKKGIKAPLTGSMLALPNNFLKKYAISGAYGVICDFMQENGKLLYGPADPRFKEFLTTLRKWYTEGLIDPQFATNNSKTVEAKMTGGEAGALCGTAGGAIAPYMKLARSKDPQFTLAGAPYPVLTEGDTPKFTHLTGLVTKAGGAFVTAKNKYPKETIRFLNYYYTREGSLLGQFGIEGVSYSMENGEPKLTESVLKSNEGLSVTLFKYSRGAGTRTVGILRDDFVAQLQVFKEQREAIDIWSKPCNANVLPDGMVLTPKESSQTASRQTEIQTYVDEMMLKFVMGQEPLDRFDAYVEKIKKMGMEECIKVRQDALERYKM